jgi:hypothetical protein
MFITRYSCKILLKIEFSPQIFEKYSNIKLQKMRPEGVELFHEDGRTDTTKLIVDFGNFTNASKKAEIFTEKA